MKRIIVSAVIVLGVLAIGWCFLAKALWPSGSPQDIEAARKAYAKSLINQALDEPDACKKKALLREVSEVLKSEEFSRLACEVNGRPAEEGLGREGRHSLFLGTLVFAGIAIVIGLFSMNAKKPQAPPQS